MKTAKTTPTFHNVSWTRLSVMPATVLIWIVIVLSLSVFDVKPRTQKLAWQNPIVEFQK